MSPSNAHPTTHASPHRDALALLERTARRVDAYLDRVLPPMGAGPGRLFEAVRYSVFAGGKRLRPAFALASARAVASGSGSPGSPDGAADEMAMPLAGALELVHTYSLIHDDLPSMDDDDLRRGRP